ncbi:MAG: hypothetical protein AB8H79_20360, partial [Myxococcota bacterium]
PSRKIPMPVIAGSALAIVVGLGAFGYAAGTGQWNWAWGAFLVGLVFTMGLGMGGVMFAAILSLTKAHWGRPLKRVAESFGLFLPVAWVLLLVFLVGGLGLYPWNPDTFIDMSASGMDLTATGSVALEPHSEYAISTKPFWLSPGFFMARQLLGTLALFALGLAFVFTSLRPDLQRAKAQLGDKAPGWWGMVAGSSTDWKATMGRSEHIQQALGVILGFVYAIVFSMVAFDLLMSLSPWWYTNMFGAWFFVSSVWISLAMLGIYTLIAKEWLGISKLVTKSVTHDLGKLTLAFCMFWAYTTFAQLLPIWYTQLPEETDFLLVRLFPLTDTMGAGEVPWYYLAATVGAMCFLVPFTVLLSRGIKKMKWPFIAILSLILVGIFLERSLLVYPSVHIEQGFPLINLIVIGGGVWVGFLGLFVLVVTAVLSMIPAVNVADPKMAPHPWDEHIQSLDAAPHH